MSRNLLVLSILLNFILPHAMAADPELESLKNRIQDLERQQQEMFIQLNEGKGFLKTFLQEKMFVGGYFDTGFIFIDGPDTDPQYSAESTTIGLNISANISDQDRFVMQLQSGAGYILENPWNDPRDNPSRRRFLSPTFPTLLTQAYYEHSFSLGLNVQSGIGYTPFGRAYQEREPFLFKRRRGPQILTSGTNTNVGLSTPFWRGIHVHGAFYLEESQVGYNFYTISPTTSPGSVGAGGRLWLKYSETLTVGVSSQIGEQADDTYQTYGADTELKIGRYSVLVEYARSSVTGGNKGPESYYMMPSVEFLGGKIVGFVFADYLDSPNVRVQGNATPIKTWVKGAGINWLPLSNVRTRLGYLKFDFVGEDSVIQGQDRDADIFDLSVSVAF